MNAKLMVGWMVVRVAGIAPPEEWIVGEGDDEFHLQGIARDGAKTPTGRFRCRVRLVKPDPLKEFVSFGLER